MIRFFNGRILCFSDGAVTVNDGEVWVDGGAIAYVGPAKADMPAARESPSFSMMYPATNAMKNTTYTANAAM